MLRWSNRMGGGPRILAWSALMLVGISGCRARPDIPNLACPTPSCAAVLQQIESPDLCDESCADASDLTSGPPMTISTFQQMESWDLTLEESIELALRNSKVLQRLGGVVVNSPQAVQTLYDVAINETAPQGSVEAALSAFDAQVASSMFVNHSERKFNNIFFGGGAPTLTTNSGQFRWELSKQTAAGTQFAVRNLTDYTRNDSPVNRFASVWDTVNQLEVRQPLLRGSGVTINRIAGPNAVPGVYNGVLIARIRSDITLADFEAGLRDLVRDVERNYWELYYAYRDLDTKLQAREAARGVWENRKINLEEGSQNLLDESQFRQQFYTFQSQAQSALVGNSLGQGGVLGSERNLRRLIGLPVNDGRVLRPVSDPALAPIVFDWNALQDQTLDRAVELRRQKWTIKQRELELIAAKQLNLWDLDAVGQYGFRGFGDDLFGSRGVPEGSAVADLFSSKLDDWQMGLQLQGPIGKRAGHLAIRNAELRLVREKTLMREQQRQILHDLAADYTEVDRAAEAIKVAYNARIAANDVFSTRRIRVEGGIDNIFEVLVDQQRLAAAESAFYRAVVDYNLALMDLTYTSGGLLDRYNVYLEEGNWDSGLQLISERKAAKMVDRGPNEGGRDLPPVSSGQFPQSWDNPAAVGVSGDHAAPAK